MKTTAEAVRQEGTAVTTAVTTGGDVTFYFDALAPAQPVQYAAEFGILLEMVRKLKPQRVLEIGVLTGGTLFQWIQVMRPGGVLAAVDLPGSRWGLPDTGQPEQWQQWGFQAGIRVMPILADSRAERTVRSVKSMAPFDFVFIDGDHSYEGVKADWTNYAGMVRQGGMVALHDVLKDPGDQNIEVWRLWEEIEISGVRCEVITSGQRSGKGIGVCRF